MVGCIIIITWMVSIIVITIQCIIPLTLVIILCACVLFSITIGMCKNLILLPNRKHRDIPNMALLRVVLLSILPPKAFQIASSLPSSLCTGCSPTSAWARVLQPTSTSAHPSVYMGAHRILPRTFLSSLCGGASRRKMLPYDPRDPAANLHNADFPDAHGVLRPRSP